jgi:3-hydroxyisobutyrate dehydrogenase-like beta-hydroxyacid dehydrogenase
VSLEGLSLAAKAGIPVRRSVEVLRTNGVANFYLDRMVENIDTRNGPTQFALALAAKDSGLIVEMGRALGMPTPAGSAVMQVLVGAIAAGLGDHDWADLVAAAERQGNIELHWKT